MGAPIRKATGLVSLSALALFACTSSDDTNSGDQGTFDPGESEDPMVPCDPDTPEFTIGTANGLKATDNADGLVVRIDDAPKPPEKNFNTWRIAVLDAGGQPNTTARLNWACAWMPVHGHGSNPQSITNLGEGRFELTKQNLSMTGPWEVRLWFDAAGGGPEYNPQRGAMVAAGNQCMPSNGAKPTANVMFKICVPPGSATK